MMEFFEQFVNYRPELAATEPKFMADLAQIADHHVQFYEALFREVIAQMHYFC